MISSYCFEDDLAALRILLNKEIHFSEQTRFRPSTLSQVQPLVITLESWLRNTEGILDKDERRDIRLAILSLILEAKVGSTYDLSLYQCTTISYFLWCGPDWQGEERISGSTGLNERAVRFLEDCKNAVEKQSSR